MSYCDFIKLYDDITTEAKNEILEDSIFSLNNQTINFEKIDNIYEIHYKDRSIKIKNISDLKIPMYHIYVRNGSIEAKASDYLLFEFDTRISKVKGMVDIEKYLLSFEGIPKNFMLGENFVITNKELSNDLEIEFKAFQAINFQDIKNVIHRENIDYIKFLYNYHVYEVEFFDDFIRITRQKISISETETYKFKHISGTFTNGVFTPTYVLKRIDKNNYIEIIGCKDYASIILTLHKIEEEDDIYELIKTGSTVKKAVEIDCRYDELSIEDDDYDYVKYLRENNEGDVVIVDNHDSEDSSDPDRLFWDAVDNMLEK